MYKCTATNNLGIASTSGTLKILDESSGVSTKSLHPSGASGLKAIVDAEKSTGMKLSDEDEDEPRKQRPVFTTDLPAEVTLASGEPLLLECQIEPKPTQSFNWTGSTTVFHWPLAQELRPQWNLVLSVSVLLT